MGRVGISDEVAQYPSVLVFDAAYPPPAIGGKEKQAHLLARELVRNGLDVRALTFAIGETKSGQYEGVPVERYRRELIGTMRLLVACARHRARYAILHIHTPSRIGVALLVWGRFLGFRTVFKIPNEGLLDRRSGMACWIWLSLVRRADRLVVLEDDTAARFRDEAIPEERIVRVPNGVEVRSSIDHTQRTDGVLWLVFAGRLESQKRVCDLITAIARVRSEGVEVLLEVLGDGPEKDTLQHQASELGVESFVTFRGRVDDVVPYLRSADALVLPSEREGMPNVVLEAMSTGLPVIASRVGAVSELLGSAGERWTFQPGDLDALVACMSYASEDRESLLSYGHLLYERCVQRYSMASVAKAYCAMYSELVKGGVR